MLAIVTFLNFIENFITYFHLHFSHGVLVCWAVGWLMPWGGNDFKTYTLINNSSEELLLGGRWQSSVIRLVITYPSSVCT